MKKNIIPLTTTLLFLLLLVQCNNNKQEKIEGIWQLQTLEVNGTALNGTSLGDWKWEFNDAGGYMTDVAGAREKGRYTIKADKLILKSLTYKERPEQVLSIIHLDSIQMNLASADDKNKSTLHFLKLKDGEREEND